MSPCRLFPFLSSLAAGALAVAGFAPFALWPLSILSLAVLFGLAVRAPGRRAGFALGYLWGLGLFLAGTSWIYVSLTVYGGMPPWMGALSVLLFSAFLALYPALATAWIAGSKLSPGWRLMLLAPLAWGLTEWARGWVFTGFTWLGLGYPHVGAPLGGFAPLFGVYGVSWLAAVAAGALAWATQTAGRARWLALAGVAVLLVAGQVLRGIEWTTPEGKPTTVALAQGNVAQEMKWVPGRAEETMAEYIDLVWRSTSRLTVLPETALPVFEDRVPPQVREAFAQMGRDNGGDVLLGLPTGDPAGAYFNSVVSVGTAPGQRYSKNHLVPFGETIPLKPVFGWVLDVLHMPLADFARGGATQPPLAVGGQRVAADICYEDTFGEEIARGARGSTALVNVSNLAWFGETLAPWQHLQMSRMRALETGRMMLRSTNTGVTAIVDRDGTVVQQLPLFVSGVLQGEVQGYAGDTPYMRWLNAPVLGLWIVLAGVLAWRARRADRAGRAEV